MQQPHQPGLGGHVQGLLVRDQDKRMTAAQALQHPWVCEAGCAPDVPLEGTVMQRLQRHATYGHMKQLVLHIIAQGVIGDTTSKELEMVTALRCPARGILSSAPLASAAPKRTANICVYQYHGACDCVETEESYVFSKSNLCNMKRVSSSCIEPGSVEGSSA